MRCHTHDYSRSKQMLLLHSLLQDIHCGALVFPILVALPAGVTAQGDDDHRIFPDLLSGGVVERGDGGKQTQPRHCPLPLL